MPIQPETYMDAPTIATLNAGDNTFGAGADGISILEDVLTTPNGITLNSVGISYDSGTTITANTWDDITTRISYLSAVAPNNLNPTILAVNNTLFIENADTAPTRVINAMAGDTALPSEHFGISWVGDTLPFVMETLDATALKIKDTTLVLEDTATPQSTAITATNISIAGGGNATWASIIAGGGGVPNINQVLAVGQNANNQPITNLNSIQIASGTTLSNNSLAFNGGAGAGVITDLFSINGQQYYPYGGTPDLNAVLGAGSNANSQSITGLINVDLQTINGSSYPPATPNLNTVLSSGNNASNLNITGVNNLDVYSINGVYYPPYPISPYGLTQTLSYSNDGGGLSLTNVGGMSSVSGTLTISSQNSGAIDINSSYDTNMNGTGTFTINNGNGININSSNAIQINSTASSATLQANQNISIYSNNGSITLEVVSGYIYLYGLPTSGGGPANSLYNGGGILMIN